MNNVITFRAASPLDAPALTDILHGWIVATPWMPVLYDHATTETFIARLIAAGGVTMCETDGGVTGFLAQDQAEITALYLAPSARGAGLGKALLDHAKAGHRHLTLWTFAQNTRAQRFYRREGFCQTDETDGSRNDENLPDIRMEWTAHG